MDLLQKCKDELADKMWPQPESMEEDLQPYTATYYAWEMVKEVLVMVTAMMATPDDKDADVDDSVHHVLNGVEAALAGLTVALNAMGVLPDEALAAITGTGN
jgi:hypothetical protein